MADVTGHIGNEQVELNNAATEATLKLLLQSSISANKQTLDGIKSMAQKAGVLDPKAAEEASEGLKTVSAGSAATSAGLQAVGFAASIAGAAFQKAATIAQTLTSGNAQVSDLFNSLSFLPFGIGKVASGMAQLSKIQEEYLGTYRTISASGVNFSGSLTDMRKAASDTYMTLGDFSKVVKEHSGTFARMGGTADEGAKAFVKLSKELNSSKTGDDLRGLGYSTTQVNEGMLNYIAMTGGRTKKELENSAKLTQAAGEYMTQLDALSELSGKSREQQEQELKEASANQAYQSYLLTLDEEGKKKANAALAEANAKGGKGAMQALQSQFLGLPPMTKAAQEFTALAPAASAGLSKMTANVTDSTKTVADQQREGARLGVAVSQDIGRLGKTAANAMIMSGSALSGTVGQMQGTANQLKAQGIQSNEDAEKQLAEVQAKQKARTESEADAAAKSQKAVQELGQEILNRLLPIFQQLLQIINPVTIALADFGKYLLDSPNLLKGLGIAAVALTGLFVTWKIVSAALVAKQAIEAAKRVKEHGLSGLGPLGSKGNPMHTIGGAGGGAGGAGDIAGKAGKFGKFAKLAAGGVGGLVGGFALDYASDKLKESGNPKLAAGAGIGSAALTGAGMGAMLGPIGAAIGGLAGAAYGAYQNKDALFGGPTKPSTEKNADNKESAEDTQTNFTEEQEQQRKSQEILITEITKLNTYMADVVRYTRETSENSRRTIDAVKAMGGDLFKI